MRKLCLVLLVILLTVHISGCSINSTSGVDTENKALSDAQSDSSELLTVEDVLTELHGEYVCNAFIEEFRNTKSINAALQYDLFAALRVSSDGYYAIVGNGHEGTGVGSFDRMDYVDGKYEVYFKLNEENDMKITYTPGENVVGCIINCSDEAWSTSGETVDFMRFGSDEFMDKYLTRILFEGIDSVSVSDSGVYVNVYDIEYDISVIKDMTGVGGNIDLYSGAVYLTHSIHEDVPLKYIYEPGKVSLYDMEDKLVKVFE